jgi:hypothetical protein
MGFGPRAVDQWSWAEFDMMVEGWNLAHDAKPPPATGADLDDWIAKHGAVHV